MVYFFTAAIGKQYRSFKMSCAERSFIATYRDKINETITEQQSIKSSVKLYRAIHSNFSVCKNHTEGLCKLRGARWGRECAHGILLWLLVWDRVLHHAPWMSSTAAGRHCSSGGAGSLLAHHAQVGLSNRREEAVSLGWEQEVS